MTSVCLHLAYCGKQHVNRPAPDDLSSQQAYKFVVRLSSRKNVKASGYLQEVYRVDTDSGKPECCAPTAIAAIKALCTTVNQLHAHMQYAHQQQRKSTAVANAPVRSDIQRVVATIEAQVAASQQALDQARRRDKAKSKLNGFVKALKPSLQRISKGSSSGEEPSDFLLTSPLADGDDQQTRRSAVRQALAELQSSREGQQCFLKALLQLEGMRVLDNCLAACLLMSHPSDDDRPISKMTACP